MSPLSEAGRAGIRAGAGAPHPAPRMVKDDAPLKMNANTLRERTICGVIKSHHPLNMLYAYRAYLNVLTSDTESR
jgi:hypothetical protein